MLQWPSALEVNSIASLKLRSQTALETLPALLKRV
jgi:hypothetical protein